MRGSAKETYLQSKKTCIQSKTPNIQKPQNFFASHNRVCLCETFVPSKTTYLQSKETYIQPKEIYILSKKIYVQFKNPLRLRVQNVYSEHNRVYLRATFVQSKKP